MIHLLRTEVCGTLVKDIETRNGNNGEYCFGRIAVNKYKKDPNGKYVKKEDETQYFGILIFGYNCEQIKNGKMGDGFYGNNLELSIKETTDEFHKIRLNYDLISRSDSHVFIKPKSLFSKKETQQNKEQPISESISKKPNYDDDNLPF